MTDKELIDQANALARRFYAAMGYIVKSGFQFYNVAHPQERLCWELARIAFEELRDTDIEDALNNLEDEDEHESEGNTDNSWNSSGHQCTPPRNAPKDSLPNCIHCGSEMIWVESEANWRNWDYDILKEV